MRARRSSASILVAAVGLAACQQAAPAPIPISPVRGDYSFTERLPAQGNVDATAIKGVVSFLADTLYLDTEAGSCRLVPPPAPEQAVNAHFDCPGFTIVIDRRDPLNNSTYRMVSATTVTHTVCIEWGVDAKGNPICIQSGIEAAPTSITRSGPLHFHPVSG